MPIQAAERKLKLLPYLLNLVLGLLGVSVMPPDLNATVAILSSDLLYLIFRQRNYQSDHRRTGAVLPLP